MFNPLKGIPDLRKGIFLSRPNRFVVEGMIDGKRRRAYLPNPGRLMELLLKGRTIYLTENVVPKKTELTVVAVERDGLPVLLHTHYANDVAAFLIENDLVKGLEGYRVKRREIRIGRNRFDFLLERDGRMLVLEVKSCTLFGRDIAMFPDAVTERGRRHLNELLKIGYDTAVLFIVNSPRLIYFLPDFHTDLAFSKTIFNVRGKVKILAIGIGWRKDLSLSGEVKDLTIPWVIIEEGLNDRGSYVLVLYLRKNQDILVGKLGILPFKRGYYIYVGSATKNLSSRINRHRILRKRAFWHIDYLRERADFITALPIRSKDSLECLIARDISSISDRTIPDFGSSDCTCGGHLFAMNDNPLFREDFINLLLYYRIDRLCRDV